MLIHLFDIKRKQNYKNGILNVHDTIYLLKYDLDINKTKIQKEELSEIRFINYIEFENKLLNHDSQFVPYSEEHKLLFEYLKNMIKG